MKILSRFILLIFFLSTQSQERKSIDAYRFINAPTIDGKLTETEWKILNLLKILLCDNQQLALVRRFQMNLKL